MVCRSIKANAAGACEYLAHHMDIASTQHANGVARSAEAKNALAMKFEISPLPFVKGARFFTRTDAHGFKNFSRQQRGANQLAAILERNPTLIEEMVNVWSEQKSVMTIDPLSAILAFRPRLDVTSPKKP